LGRWRLKDGVAQAIIPAYDAPFARPLSRDITKTAKVPFAMDFRVELDVFRGPLDLLLFLVRKHELDVRDLPIALITDQYLNYLEVLQQLDVNDVGDFLELASSLIEIKSQLILPRGGEEAESWDDPRDQLVERLLEYKKYKDAASMLDERSRDWQQHYPRLASDAGPRDIAPADQPIREVELWDLVSAMGRILRDSQATSPATIIYDETPIQVYMRRIHHQLVTAGRAAFSDLFESGMHKSAIVGVFLAVLELARHHGVRTEQNELHGEIWIVPGESFDPAEEIASGDEYANRGS
jgi:segregation and condensation protein A